MSGREKKVIQSGSNNGRKHQYPKSQSNKIKATKSKQQKSVTMGIAKQFPKNKNEEKWRE
ncbi:MAG: hypothetical protein II067_03735 [Agathobacter sp.]|uniref:hypothetical protein n=1 Tax=Agathobacter sp. TaxID=2021311 RepID=UPI00257B8B19|nr:hypothetical protein [Agathobacter sp.]MBQ1681311.1 hypothetical protein [Agathobacter sp.]